MVYNVGIDEKGGALRMAEYRDRGDRRTGRLEMKAIRLEIKTDQGKVSEEGIWGA